VTLLTIGYRVSTISYQLSAIGYDKPPATQGEARLRERERIMYSKTIIL